MNPLSLKVPIDLIGFDGTETSVRGTVAVLRRSEGELDGVFSASGLNAWVRAVDVANPRAVAHVRVTDPRDGSTETHRVFDRETVGGVTRFQLIAA